MNWVGVVCQFKMKTKLQREKKCELYDTNEKKNNNKNLHLIMNSGSQDTINTL